MTERLRTLIHYISKYFQTLEFMEKTLSDKNEPPPCIDTCLQLFLNFGNYGQKTLSDKNEPPPYIDTYLQIFFRFGNYGKKNALR